MRNLPVLLVLICAMAIAVVLFIRSNAAKQEVMAQLGPAMKRMQPSLQNGSTIAFWNTTKHTELLPRCRYLLAPVKVDVYNPGLPADTVLALAGKDDMAAQRIIARVAAGNILQQYTDSAFSYTLLYLPEGLQ